jgi:sugar phosphate isomerase/epimerase
MVTGDDPVGAVHTLKDYIVHTHAKDGKRLFAKDPELIYGIVQEDPSAVIDAAFLEVPLGEGQVDFPAYLKALDEIGYRGFLTIEREVGQDPVGDVKSAVEFLRSLMSREA